MSRLEVMLLFAPLRGQSQRPFQHPVELDTMMAGTMTLRSSEQSSVITRQSKFPLVLLCETSIYRARGVAKVDMIPADG